MAAVGFSNDSCPRSRRYSGRGCTAFGGHASNVRHWFAPVWNTATLGSAAPQRSFSRQEKKGNPMLSRKNCPVLLPNLRTPSVSLSLRFQAPCVHGPMTNVRVVAALISSSDWFSRSGPYGSSPSYHPPTVSTAGLMFFSCFQIPRFCQYAS